MNLKHKYLHLFWVITLYSCGNSSNSTAQNEIYQPITEDQNNLYVTNQWELTSPVEAGIDVTEAVQASSY